MPEQYQTKDKCINIHEKVNRWGKWLATLLVALLASVLLAAGLGWNASSQTKSLETEVRGNYTSLDKSLDVIQTDVREIRATQQELLGKRYDDGGGE